MIRLKDVHFNYNGTPVLKGITVGIREGEAVGIIGPNGAGKSTLLKLLNGILVPAAGEVVLFEQPVQNIGKKKLARQVGLVSQEFHTAFDYTVYDIVMMGRFPYLSPFSSESPADLQVVRQAMEATEIWEFRRRRFNQLSGGEKQRVILASALAQEPKILLLDEPTTALDLKHQVHFFNILADLQKQKTLTIIIATHDINLAGRFCERLLVLKNGLLAADGAPEQILTKALMESIYDIEVDIIVHPGDGKPLLVPAGAMGKNHS